MKPTSIAPDYTAFLTEVKGRIQTARLQAGRAVNRELVMLYWDIGRGILEKQQVGGWGGGAVRCGPAGGVPGYAGIFQPQRVANGSALLRLHGSRVSLTGCERIEEDGGEAIS